MANTNPITTRIQLRYDLLSAWSTDAAKARKPLKGEVCAIEIPAGTSTINGVTVQTPPTVLFKVGDGEKTFDALPIMSALAADVHAWAKTDYATFTARLKNGVETGDIKFVDKDTFDALAARVQTLETTVGNLSAGSLTDVKAKTSNTVLTSTEIVKSGTEVTIDDSKITSAIATAKSEAISAASQDAQSKVDPINAKLEGITEATVKAHVAAQKAAVIGTATDNSEADTIKGAKKYSDEKAAAVLGETNDDATKNTVYGAKAAAAAANTAAGTAQDKADQAFSKAEENAGEISTIKGQISALGNTYATDKELEDAIDAAKTALVGDDTTANTIKKAIKDAADAHSAADAAQGAAEDAQEDATKALNKLSGISDGEGTVKKYVDDAVTNIVTTYLDPETTDATIDTLKEVADWITKTDGAAASLADHESRLDAIEPKVTGWNTAASQTHTHAKSDSEITDAVNKKHSHTFVESELNNIKSGDVAKWNAAEQNAKDFAQGLADALDGRTDTLEGKVKALEGKELTDTTYAFASGTNGTFTVTPEGGSAQTVDTGAKKYTDDTVKPIQEAVDTLEAVVETYDSHFGRHVDSEGAVTWDTLVFNCGTASTNW